MSMDSASVRLTEPPETDLDYYARPENYTGSNLSTLTRFLVAKDKEESKTKKSNKKKKKHINEERQLYRRYRHILPQELFGSSSSSSSSTSSSEDEEQKVDEEANKENHRHKQSGESLDNTPSPTTKGGNVKATFLKSSEEDSRLPTILSSDNDNYCDSESETESGYASRLRSQEEQFRNASQLTSTITETTPEAWATLPADSLPSLSHPRETVFNNSPNPDGSPRDSPRLTSTTSLTGSLITRMRGDSSSGLGSMTKLLAMRGKLLALSTETRRRLVSITSFVHVLALLCI
ncbi:hypothetical protein PoB_000189900 [Plakobranchus ocellatus]|uniref:Uncharacterized protein n=1 Tax=Plakobranchus ocellatus TaxID=259542 RepID=A0AAV3XZM3_9GAST|nr:hypothetical protein PoB_000189900 [Plakobranchus ocellatus]